MLLPHLMGEGHRPTNCIIASKQRACLLHWLTITMVDVQVNIQHSLKLFQQLKYRQDDVITVAETSRFISTDQNSISRPLVTSSSLHHYSFSSFSFMPYICTHTHTHITLCLSLSLSLHRILFSVVPAPIPVDGHLRLLSHQTVCQGEASPSNVRHVLKNVCKRRTVVPCQTEAKRSVMVDAIDHTNFHSMIARVPYTESSKQRLFDYIPDMKNYIVI